MRKARVWFALVGLVSLAIRPVTAQQPSAQDVPQPDVAALLFHSAVDARPLSEPARDQLFSCSQSTMAPARSVLPWVQTDGTIDNRRKPHVNGAVTWPGHRLHQIMAGPDRTVTTTGLPGHATGRFPVNAQDSPEAYEFDRNSHPIRGALRVYALPAAPEVAARPSCLPAGPIGISLAGPVFFSALDAERRDAVATEIFDRCEGHPDRLGVYHYHHASPCFDQGPGDRHSPLVGYALDGFGIYGPRDADGRAIANDALDECHGHVGPVPSADRATVTAYHYHINTEFPYTLGCFRGTPSLRPGAR